MGLRNLLAMCFEKGSFILALPRPEKDVWLSRVANMWRLANLFYLFASDTKVHRQAITRQNNTRHKSRTPRERKDVVTCKFCICCLVNKVATLNIPAFYVCGIAESKQNIGNRNNGLRKNLRQEKILNLVLLDPSKKLLLSLRITLGLMK